MTPNTTITAQHDGALSALVLACVLYGCLLQYLLKAMYHLIELRMDDGWKRRPHLIALNLFSKLGAGNLISTVLYVRSQLADQELYGGAEIHQYIRRIFTALLIGTGQLFMVYRAYLMYHKHKAILLLLIPVLGTVAIGCIQTAFFTWIYAFLATISSSIESAVLLAKILPSKRLATQLGFVNKAKLATQIALETAAFCKPLLILWVGFFFASWIGRGIVEAMVAPLAGLVYAIAIVRDGEKKSFARPEDGMQPLS